MNDSAVTKKMSLDVLDMTEGSIFKKLLRYSLPFVLANLLNTLYTLADAAVIGRYCGSVALSAVSISGTATMLLYSLGIGFGTGGQVLLAQFAGANQKEQYQSTIATLLLSCGALAVLMSVLGTLSAETVMGWLNTPEEAMEQALAYVRICCVGVLPAYVYNTFAHALRGIGDAKTPFYIILITSVMNVVLDILFVACFDMGVAGAAWATVASQICSGVFCVIYLYPRRDAFGFDFDIKGLRVDVPKLKTIAKLSMPLVVSNIAICISMLFITGFVNVYGVTAAAVNGVGHKLSNVISIISGAMMASAASFVGQNVGARKMRRAAASVLCALAIGIVFWGVFAVVCVFWPEWVFGLFSTDPAVLEMAVPYLRINIWMYLASVLMSPFLGLINGVGRTGYGLLISLLDGVVARIGLSVLFGVTLSMGLYGYWIGSAAAGYVSVILGGLYFMSGKWKESILIDA